MEKPLKWFYQLTEEELKAYPLDRIIVGFDRVDREYITANEIFVVRPIGYNLNHQRIEDNKRRSP